MCSLAHCGLGEAYKTSRKEALSDLVSEEYFV